MEKKISNLSNITPGNQNIVSYVDQQSSSSNPTSFKRTFDIEEVVKAHPEVRTKKFKATIKKQEKYIEYLNKLLFDIIDESAFIISSNCNSPQEAKNFRAKIVTNLEHFRNQEEMEIDQDDILTIDDQKHQSDAFISKTHEDIIKRFKNLEKIYDAQQESTTKSHLVQDLVEDFCNLANKMKDTELALQQIDIMKEYHSR